MLRRAWEQVVERHAALRTVFDTDGADGPAQEVLPGVALPWEEWDWSGISRQDMAGQLDAYLHADRRRGFEPVQRLCGDWSSYGLRKTTTD